MAKKAPAAPSYEQALSELEQIVTHLESVELPLEDALNEFERGVQLARLGQQTLQQAEQRVQILLNDDKDAPISPFNADQEYNMVVFEQLLKPYHQRADAAVLHYIDPLPFSDGQLDAPMRYGALLGGKRLRPFLVYATGEMFGLSLDNLTLPLRPLNAFTPIR